MLEGNSDSIKNSRGTVQSCYDKPKQYDKNTWDQNVKKKDLNKKTLPLLDSPIPIYKNKSERYSL